MGWQEIIVFIIVALAAVGLFRQLFKKSRINREDKCLSDGENDCAGCPLAEKCRKPSPEKPSKNG